MILNIPRDVEGPIIIGVDCATVAKKRGISLGYLRNGRLVLCYAGKDTETKEDSLSDLLELLRLNYPILLCLDAPLGWPMSFKEELSTHIAGQGLSSEVNTFFKRRTDIYVSDMFSKRPLEVTANFIARTAYSALSLLEQLALLGREFQLAHSAAEAFKERSSVMEVYPAGTLCSIFGAKSDVIAGYKAKDAGEVRRHIFSLLEEHLELQLSAEQFALSLANDDVFDACICALAGADFLLGRCMSPEGKDALLAQNEGWIWVRGPKTTAESR